MKILKNLIITLLFAGLTACSSDDDGNIVDLTAESIAGTYEVVFFEGSTEVTTTASNGATVVTERETFTTDTFTDSTFTFNTNGTYSSTGSYRITYVLTVTGQPSETNSEIEDFSGSGTYAVNTTSRTITFDGDEINDVTLFNGTDLRITGTEVDTFNGNTETETYEIRLVKQS